MDEGTSDRFGRLYTDGNDNHGSDLLWTSLPSYTRWLRCAFVVDIQVSDSVSERNRSDDEGLSASSSRTKGSPFPCVGFPAGKFVITHHGSGAESIRKYDFERLSGRVLSAYRQSIQKRQLSVRGYMDGYFCDFEIISHSLSVARKDSPQRQSSQIGYKGSPQR